jgi:hypothetical protein
LFRRLLRPNAQSVDRPGVDEFSPALRRHSQTEYVERTPPNTRTAKAVSVFRGTIVGPNRLSRPAFLGTGSPPDLRASYYTRARHGEGLFGIEPLIPEGEIGG